MTPVGFPSPAFYGAGHFVNEGTINFNQDYSINFGTIDNSGTINIPAGGAFWIRTRSTTRAPSTSPPVGCWGTTSIINNWGTITNGGTIDNENLYP